MVSGASPSVPQTGGPVILELPLDKIRRPLLRTRSNDQEKVKDLMDSIRQIGLQVPVRTYYTSKSTSLWFTCVMYSLLY